MTLVASGTLWMVSTTDGNDRSIMYEVEGVESTPFQFSNIISHTNPSLGSLPISFSDYYGHTQSNAQGRCYSTNNWTTNAYMSIAGSIFSAPTSDSVTLKYTNGTGSTETVWYAQGPAGQAFDSGQVDCFVYRRTKQTTDAWGTAITSWADYTSQTYSCDFGTYDYLWIINTQ